MKPEASNIPALRFSEFNDHWNVLKLGEIAQFRRGSFPQPYGLDQWYDDESGFPFVQVFDVGEHFRLKSTTKRRISKEAQALSVFVGRGTLVLTLQGSIGRLAITQYDAFVDRTLLIFESFRLDTNKYFFMYSVFLLFQKEKQKAPGGTIKTITKEVLTDFNISLPRIAEQNKIGSFLESVDDRIAQLITKKKLLIKYKEGLMQQIFDRKIRFKKANGKDFPEWEEEKLGDIATFSKGYGISKEDTSPNGLYECIRYGELYTQYAETIDEVVSRTSVGESELTFSKENDVIIPSSGETNIDIARAACVLRKGIALGGDLTIIRSNLNGVFLSYYLNSKKKYDIARLAQGVSVVHLYPNHLATLRIEVPSADEQRLIAEFLSLVDKKIALVNDQMGLTKTFKNGSSSADVCLASMKLVRTLISQNSDKYEHFSYYEGIIDVIEQEIQSHPDICIESCKSLIEGISKTIIKTLDKTASDADLKKMDVMPLFKRAANKLAEFDSTLEIDFINRTGTLVENFGKLRNDRGDISHGRAAPKTDFSSPEFSTLAARVTEALASYVLEHFFRLQLPDETEVKYGDNLDFNEMLDKAKPMGSLSFSKALFDQDKVSYCEQLLDYRTEQEEILEKTIFEGEPDT